jgi:glycine dehydrogenase subunit 2
MKYNPLANEVVARLSGFAGLHPLTPDANAQGALQLCWELQEMLAEICGMDEVSLQPAAGAHGELTGMKMVRAYHRDNGDARRVVLIPASAHGTNPASAALAGYSVQTIEANQAGLVEADTVRRAMTDQVAALMITNPNTLGLFEREIAQIAEAVHARGGLVYFDGANLNALLGVAKPGQIGADVLQFNLHKTFSTPHGGGGPGAGPYRRSRALGARTCGGRAWARTAMSSRGARAGRSIGRVRAFPANDRLCCARLRLTSWRSAGDGLTMRPRMAVLAAKTTSASVSAGTYQLRRDANLLRTSDFTDKTLESHGVKDARRRQTPPRPRLLRADDLLPARHVSGAIMVEPTGDREQADARRVHRRRPRDRRRGA